MFSLLESTGVIPAKKLEKHRFLGHVYALLVVLIGFVMFRAGTVNQGLSFLRAMFTGFSASTAATVALHQVLSVEAAIMLVLGVLFCLPTRRNDRTSIVSATSPVFSAAGSETAG